MVIRRRAEKPNTLRPLRNAFEVLFDDIRDNGLALLRLLGIVYLVLLLIAVPLTAAALIPINSNSTFASNVAFIFDKLIEFLKGSNYVIPGAGDYLLASVALLYHRNLRAPIAFLLGAGLMFLLTNYGLQPVADYVKSAGSQSKFALEYAYTAFLLGIAVSSIFLPTIVASKLKRATWVRYFLVNGLIGWFPPFWVLLLFLAFKPPKAKGESSAKEKTVDISSTKIETPVQQSDKAEYSKEREQSKPAPPQNKQRKKKKGFRKK